MHANRPPEGDSAPQYIDVPAGQGRWRLSQLHQAGIHTDAQFGGGRARLGPLTPAEYAAAWAAMERKQQPAQRSASALLHAPLIIVGAALVATAAGGVALSLVAGAVLMAAVGASMLAGFALRVRADTRRNNLARRHPDPLVRSASSATWWTPWAGWAVAALFVLAMVGAAMAMALGG